MTEAQAVEYFVNMTGAGMIIGIVWTLFFNFLGIE